MTLDYFDLYEQISSLLGDPSHICGWVSPNGVVYQVPHWRVDVWAPSANTGSGAVCVLDGVITGSPNAHVNLNIYRPNKGWGWRHSSIEELKAVLNDT